MNEEDLWFAEDVHGSVSLRGDHQPLGPSEWRIFMGDDSVLLDKRDMENLFRAVEKELYPERVGVSFKRSPEEILSTFWEFVPTHCPVCGERLKKSRFGDWYCTSYHGKTYSVCVQGQTMWKWFLMEGIG